MNTTHHFHLPVLGAAALVALTSLMACGCNKADDRPAADPPKQSPTTTPAPQPAPASEPAKVEPPKSEPPTTEPAKPEPAKVDPPKVDAPTPPTPDPAKPAPIPHQPLAKDAKPMQTFTTPTGVIVEEHKDGTGFPVLPKALVTMHFELRIKDSWKLIQSTWNDGEPESRRIELLVLGLGDGLMGMRKGAVRRIIVPPSRGFPEGAKDADGNEMIPPGTTLVFDVELLDIKQNLVEEIKPNPNTAKPAAAPIPNK